MRISQPLALTTLAAVAALTVAGCASESDDAPVDHSSHAEHAAHAERDHPADGGPAPAGIVEAADPTYPVGTEVTLTADHMPGMDGATATISGAFDTTAYAVSYTPTDGGAPVTNHKWVVQEELEGTDGKTLGAGDTAVMTADHMAGMQGAEATIDSSTDETVYMVDIDSPEMTMKRHKWVVESEIQPK